MKQTVLITLLLSLLCWKYSFSQELTVVDSLEQVLETTSVSDEKKVFLQKLSQLLRKSDSTKALKYANEALLMSLSENNPSNIQSSYFWLAKIYDAQYSFKTANKYYASSLESALETKNDSIIARAYSQLGLSHSRLGEYSKAILYHLDALKLREKSDNAKPVAYSHNFIGVAYQRIGIYDEALKHHFSALKIIKKDNSLELKSFTLTNIAFVHQQLGNYEKALNYHLEALSLRKKIKNDFLIAHSLQNVARVHCSLQDYSQALDYSLPALSLMEKNAPLKVPIVLNIIGNIYFETKQYDKALPYFTAANLTAKKSNIPLLITESKINLGKIYAQRKEYQKAKEYLEKGLSLARKIKSPSLINSCYQQLSYYYKTQGKYEKSLKYFQLYSALKDTIFSTETASNIANIELVSALNEQQKKFASKQEKQQNESKKLLNSQKNITFFFVLITGFFCLLAAIIYYNYRNKQKQNALLGKQNVEIQYQQEEIVLQNEKLQEASREKDALMGIVAHDLKSPLNKILGLATLVKLEGELNEAQVAHLKLMTFVVCEGGSLIQDILDVNAFEYSNDSIEIEEIDLSKTLQEKIDSFKQQADSKYIKLFTELPDIQLNTDSKLIARILDNLVSNAIKFSPQGKNIYIKSWKEGGNTNISIKDEGQGISEEDQKKMFRKFQKLSAVPTAGESSNGLGLSIVKNLVKRLNAEIKVNSILGQGTEFIISFSS